MENLLGSSKQKEWPRKFHSIQDNGLRTTVLDEELNENQSNENHILPLLMIVYERHFLLHSQTIPDRFVILNSNGLDIRNVHCPLEICMVT